MTLTGPYGSLKTGSVALGERLREALIIPKVDSRIPIALIGCGWVAREHLRAYKAAGINVVALCDRHRERAESCQQEFYPDAAIYTDEADVFRHSGVRVVDIATHVDSRPESVRQALRAGMHVLSQKPYVEDLEEGARLAEEARSKGLWLAVNHNGRWAPHFGAMLACVRSGIIGNVVSADFMVAWEHDTDVASRPAAAVFSSMSDLILYDFGAHWFDLVGVLAPSTELLVSAVTVQRPGQVISTPTQAQTVISGDGFIATLNFRAAERFAEFGSYRISGTAGVIAHVGRSLGGDRVVVYTEEGEAVIPISDDWFGHGVSGAMGELLGAIESGCEPRNSPPSSLRGLSLCFAAIASAKSGEVVVAGTQTRRIQP